MSTTSDTERRFTVKCGCGCFSVTFRSRPQSAAAELRCPVCDARVALPSLLRAWRSAAAAGALDDVAA